MIIKSYGDIFQKKSKWFMAHGGFQSWRLVGGRVIPDFQMQHQQAAVSHVLERSGKLTQGLHDLLWHRGQIHVRVTILSRRKHWRKGRGQTPIISLHAYWVLKWHVILLFIMLLLPIWLMLVLAALDVQDRIDYFCPWLNTEAQMIESIWRMTKNRPSELGVTSTVIWPNHVVYACVIYTSAGGCSVSGRTPTQMFVKGLSTPSEAAEPISEGSDHPTSSHICLPWSCQLCSHSRMCQHFKY